MAPQSRQGHEGVSRTVFWGVEITKTEIIAKNKNQQLFTTSEQSMELASMRLLNTVSPKTDDKLIKYVII